jgi:hypothetical protein
MGGGRRGVRRVARGRLVEMEEVGREGGRCGQVGDGRVGQVGGTRRFGRAVQGRSGGRGARGSRVMACGVHLARLDRWVQVMDQRGPSP